MSHESNLMLHKESAIRGKGDKRSTLRFVPHRTANLEGGILGMTYTAENEYEIRNLECQSLYGSASVKTIARELAQC
jgi:hypothetical protein